MEMSKRYKITVAISILLVVTGIVLLAALTCGIRGEQLDRYLCLRCAAKRETYCRRLLGVPYAQGDTISATALSRRIAQHDREACRHDWKRTRFGIHSGGTFLDGGISGSQALCLFTDQEDVAADLITFAESASLTPQEVWGTVLSYMIQCSEAGHDPALVYDWIDSGFVAHQSVYDWLRENYSKMTSASAEKPCR